MMKPLNHKERDDKFFNFVVAGTITLGIVIFCFYYTNDFLTDAISEKRVAQFGRFQQYKRNQQRYTKQLDEINKSLSGNFRGAFMPAKLISEFKASFTKNGDTSLLMSKIVDLSDKAAGLVELRNQSAAVLNGLKQDLRDCKAKLNKSE